MVGMKTKILFVMLVAALANGVFAMGTRSNTASGGVGTPIKDLVLSDTLNREIEIFNILYTQSTRDYENLTNMIDGLLETLSPHLDLQAPPGRAVGGRERTGESGNHRQRLGHRT